MARFKIVYFDFAQYQKSELQNARQTLKGKVIHADTIPRVGEQVSFMVKVDERTIDVVGFVQHVLHHYEEDRFGVIHEGVSEIIVGPQERK